MNLAARCQGLVKRYDAVVAVDHLDLEVHSGECFGLLGPNGAGKTTTVEILQGVIRPDEGVVEVLGHRWDKAPGRIRQRIGSQLQETKFPDKLKVGEVVELFRSFYHEGHTVDQVLAQVELTEKRDAWVEKLSGGQRQRLAVAAALVSEPDLLFLDEPTTGLDPQSRRQLWDIITEFRSRGHTILLTTHYMEEAHRLCDRVGIVDRGRMIAEGTPRELINSLGAEHVVEVTVDVDVPLDELRALPAVADVQRDDAAVRLTVEALHRAVPAVIEWFTGRGIEMTGLTTHQATLEDVFIALTGRHLRDG